MRTPLPPTSGAPPPPVDGVRFQPSAPGAETERLLAFGARLANSYSDALTVINGHAGLLLERQGLEPDVVQHVAAIYRSGEQAMRLTRQLLIASGRYPMHFGAVNLHQLISELTPSIQSLLGAGRRLDISLAQSSAVVWADAEMLEQLLLSLTTNAGEALPRGGRFFISTEIVALSETEAARHREGRPGSFVCVVLRDDGGGMSPEVLARAFEPFFAANADAKIASGLGLAVVQSIVKNSGGWLNLESEPNKGTGLTLFLPCAPAVLDDAAATEEPPSARRSPATILVVDDEPAVRELTAMILQGLGHRVLQATDGTAALEVWKWHYPRIDLLFTDVVLPGNLNGLDLAARFQTEKPLLKIVCLTGNLDSLPNQGASKLLHHTRFLQKPCSSRIVGQTVRDLLDQK